MVRMEPVFCPSDDQQDATHTAKRDARSLLQRFSRVQAEIVHLENPELAEHMIMCGVEPHMYLLRWMRLLCSRECSNVWCSPLFCIHLCSFFALSLLFIAFFCNR